MPDTKLTAPLQSMSWLLGQICQEAFNSNKYMKQNICYFRVEMALFGTPPQAQKPSHSFKHCWWALFVETWVNPQLHGTLKQRTLAWTTHLWAAKMLNAAMANSCAPSLPKHPKHDFYDGTLWEANKAPFIKVQLQIMSDLTCDSLPKNGQNYRNICRRRNI